MVDVEALVAVDDICGASSVTLASVASDEPDDAPGRSDGHTAGDIQDADVGMADFNFRLRAERMGNGNGRTYTVAYAASDASGNEASASDSVYVPHDRGGVTEPIEIFLDQDEAAFVLSWTPVEDALHYSVIRGRLRDIAETEHTIDLDAVLCVEPQSPSEAIIVSEAPVSPAPGSGFFYLVEYDDGTRSSYGTESASKPRVVASGNCE
jgi:hypothetical protein